MNIIKLPFFGSNVLFFTEILEISKHFSVSMVHVTSNVNVRRLNMTNILFALSSSETKSSFWSKSFTLPVIHTGNFFSPSTLFSFPCAIVFKTFVLFVSVWNRILLWNSQYQCIFRKLSFFWNNWDLNLILELLPQCSKQWSKTRIILNKVI